MKIRLLILIITALIREVKGQCSAFTSPITLTATQGTITSSNYTFANNDQCSWTLMPQNGVPSVLRIDTNNVQLGNCPPGQNLLFLQQGPTTQNSLCGGSTSQCFLYSYSQTSAQCQTEIADQNCMLTANLNPSQQLLSLRFIYYSPGWQFSLTYRFIECTGLSTTTTTLPGEITTQETTTSDAITTTARYEYEYTTILLVVATVVPLIVVVVIIVCIICYCRRRKRNRFAKENANQERRSVAGAITDSRTSVQAYYVTDRSHQYEDIRDAGYAVVNGNRDYVMPIPTTIPTYDDVTSETVPKYAVISENPYLAPLPIPAPKYVQWQ